ATLSRTLSTGRRGTTVCFFSRDCNRCDVRLRADGRRVVESLGLGGQMTVNVRRLLFVRALRAFGDGYVSLLLPVYLLSLGLTPFEVGVIATTTLLGSGALTLWVGLHAYRFRYRVLVFASALLMTATGMGFSSFTAFSPFL